jgi:murein DD-endopeptidase MepM/ murein hydrolase activator NlpD
LQRSRVVRRGDTISSIWSEHEASSAGGNRAAQAFREAGIDIGSLQVGEELQLSILKDDIVGLRRTLKDGRTLVLDGDSERGYNARVDQPIIVEKERLVSGTITYSLSEAAANLAIPYSVVDDLVDLLSDRIEFRKDLQPGDSFTVVYNERRTESGMELEPGPIQAATVNTGGKMVMAIRHIGNDKKAYYYDGEGNVLGNYFLRYPLQFTRISSVFTTARFHPVLKITRPHNGVDFAAPIGTPVRTVADGVIEYASYNGEGGNMIRIRHDDRYTTAYLHLSKIAAGLRPGLRVSRGQVIGAVGMTGLATGPHLHFSLYDHGTSNPARGNASHSIKRT